MKKKKRKETKARKTYDTSFRRKYGYTIKELCVLLKTNQGMIQRWNWENKLQDKINAL